MEPSLGHGWICIPVPAWLPLLPPPQGPTLCSTFWEGTDFPSVPTIPHAQGPQERKEALLGLKAVPSLWENHSCCFSWAGSGAVLCPYHVQLPVAVTSCHLALWLEPCAGGLEEAVDGHVEGLQLRGFPGSPVLELGPVTLLGDTRHVPAKLLQHRDPSLETPNSTLIQDGKKPDVSRAGLELVQPGVVGADPGTSPAVPQLLQCSPRHVLPAVPIPSPPQGQIPCSSTATVTLPELLLPSSPDDKPAPHLGPHSSCGPMEGWDQASPPPISSAAGPCHEPLAAGGASSRSCPSQAWESPLPAPRLFTHCWMSR